MAFELKKHLLESYGSFADRRIKKLDRGDTFIIDDRSNRDFDAKRDLYSYFCLMFVRVIGDDEIELLLERNVPMSPEVEEFIKANGGTIQSEGASVTLRLRPIDSEVLRELARRIRFITQPGRRYKVANYKYVVPRTAQSLERLAGFLESYSRS